MKTLTSMTLLLMFVAAPPLAQAAAQVPVICLALPKAQLGQGNNSPVDVSEPVRTALGQYMAGPSVQLVRLDARIPIQIEAEAAEKHCAYVLQTSVVQKKKGGSIFKKLAPLTNALPMVTGMSGNMGNMMATQAVASTVASAAAADAQQDYMAQMSAQMTGAQQSNVKAGDTLTVEYAFSKVGGGVDKKEALAAKAAQDGEDVIGPLLEQVATSVLTVALAK